MGISSIIITLEPDLGVYLPGQNISGSVHVQVSSLTKCRAVEVKCSGKSRVKWTEKVNDENRTFDASETYFKLSKNVWWPPSRDTSELDAGNYSWPFLFSIPQDLPSSFEGTVGYVRYKIKAKADIPLGTDDKTSLYFSVNYQHDLNYDDKAKAPLTIRKSDTSCCWCCMKGPVSLNFNCLRSGAVVGENFLIRGEITNQGSKMVEGSEVCLYQHVKYHADGKKHTSKNLVGRVTRGCIEPGDSDIYEDVPLLIPAVVPDLRNCHLMDVNYEIVFSANFGACANVSDTHALTIGTVPFLKEGALSSMPPAAMAPPPTMGYPPPAAPYPAAAPYPPQGGPEGAPLMAAPPPDIGFTGAVTDPSAPPPEAMGGMPMPPTGYVAVDGGMPPGMPAPMGMGAPGMPPPMGMPGMAMLMMPPMIGIPTPPDNPYTNKHPPHAEEAYFCTTSDKRTRLDSKATAPKYISFAGAM